MKNNLILATNNPGKIEELVALLKPITCIPQAELNIEEVEETGLSFVENALIKARHASLLGGRPAIADDSGLVVEALEGAPGIYSARFANMNHGIVNNTDYLLQRMHGVPLSQRGAYFYCVIVLLRHANDPAPLIATGKWDGFISLEQQGNLGFGYDPVFYLPEHRCTAAQLDAEKKNKVSHRAIAMKTLHAALENEAFYV